VSGFLAADGRPLHEGDRVIISGHPQKMPLDPGWHGQAGTVVEFGASGHCSLRLDGRRRPTRRVFHPLGLIHDGARPLRTEAVADLLGRRLAYALRKLAEAAGESLADVEATVRAHVPDRDRVLD
jgi:hypothetical protein